MEPLAEKRQFWQKHVLQAQLHAGSLADYAKQHQLKATALYYWARVLNRSAGTKQAAVEPVGFSAVHVSSAAPAADYVIHVSSRLTLRGSVLPNPQWLAELCRQLDAST
jgi:hypothetical protein